MIHLAAKFSRPLPRDQNGVVSSLSMKVRRPNSNIAGSSPVGSEGYPLHLTPNESLKTLSSLGKDLQRPEAGASISFATFVGGFDLNSVPVHREF